MDKTIALLERLLTTRMLAFVKVDEYEIFSEENGTYTIIKREFRKRHKVMADNMTLDAALSQLIVWTKAQS